MWRAEKKVFKGAALKSAIIFVIYYLFFTPCISHSYSPIGY